LHDGSTPRRSPTDAVSDEAESIGQAITGAPATINFSTQPLLHHTLGDYQIPLRMYEKITTASTQLSSGETAPDKIDRVLSMCVYYQLPVYISIPSGVVMMKCDQPGAFPSPVYAPSDP